MQFGQKGKHTEIGWKRTNLILRTMTDFNGIIVNELTPVIILLIRSTIKTVGFIMKLLHTNIFLRVIKLTVDWRVTVQVNLVINSFLDIQIKAITY